MSSNRYDDSEEEDDFNPAPADLSDEEPDQPASDNHARESSPADDAPAPSKSRVIDDDDEEDEDDAGQHDDDDEEEDEDDEDEDDVQQVSLSLLAPSA